MSIPFKNRHIGPREDQIQKMLSVLGFNSLEDLIKTVVPDNISSSSPTDIPIEMSESETIQRLKELAGQNKV
jgi:glycine dehydrogenase